MNEPVMLFRMGVFGMQDRSEDQSERIELIGFEFV